MTVSVNLKSTTLFAFLKWVALRPMSWSFGADRTYRTLFAMLLPFLLSANVHAAAPTCAPMAHAQQDVSDVVRQMYGALQKDDLALFQAQVTPDFYAFDTGTRFTAQSLVGLIKMLHDQGMKFEWTVPDPEVHVTCDQAWLTYTNRGSVEAAGVKRPAEWLESALLEYRSGVWRIRFFHSTQVPPPKSGM